MPVTYSIPSVITWLNHWGNMQHTQPLKVTKPYPPNCKQWRSKVVHFICCSCILPLHIFQGPLHSNTQKQRERKHLSTWEEPWILLLNNGWYWVKVWIYQKPTKQIFSTSQNCSWHNIKAVYQDLLGLLCQDEKISCAKWGGKYALGFELTCL